MCPYNHNVRRNLLILLTLCLLASCSGQGRLAGRAADYYSLLAGHGSRAKVSAYYSPAYRKTLKPEAVKTIDNAIYANSDAESRYPKASAKDIATRIEGRFALTTANPELGDVYINQRVTKWVKVGMKWYLYLNSTAEADAYGPFPVGMLPPKFGAGEE
jgi:hypothetical protein